MEVRGGGESQGKGWAGGEEGTNEIERKGENWGGGWGNIERMVEKGGVALGSGSVGESGGGGGSDRREVREREVMKVRREVRHGLGGEGAL